MHLISNLKFSLRRYRLWACVHFRVTLGKGLSSFMSKISETFTTGAVVPASGIYSVSHGAHRLFSEVALFKGEFFPKCERCSNVVKKLSFEQRHLRKETVCT